MLVATRPLRRIAATIALISSILAPCTPALAQATGGAGGFGVFESGGNGGNANQAGGATAFTGTPGGAAGTPPGGDGGDGGTSPVFNTRAGSGGGGGADGAVGSTIGGNGGDGGNAGTFGGNSVGGGGGGGSGTGLAINGNFINTGLVQGGSGGAGGSGGPGDVGNAANGGGGGGGGFGIVATSSGLTITNRTGFSIIGGSGGGGGGGSTGTPAQIGVAGPDGAGGVGIQGSGLTVINDGTIAGGLSGDGTVRTNAITFIGGTNFLNLNPSGVQGTLTGNIGVTGSLTFNQPNGVTLSSTITGPGSIIQNGTGALTLTRANNYTGTTTVADGRLAAGGVDVFSPNSHTAVENGGTLDLHGFNQALNDGLTNGGVVQLGVPGATAPGSTLTIAGNYVGMGGDIRLNTFLGADNSPSDRLVINGGTATGNTVLHVTNVGGPGEETRSNGILVVQAINGATTDPFTLANPRLRAGALDYRLFQGSPNGSDPTVANDWFLRSSFIGPDGSINPIIGPELATYGVVQPIARQMGVTMLGTLHERVGDTLTLDNAGPDAEGWGRSGWARSGWARFFGQQIDNQYKSFAEPSTTGRLFGVQAGFDIFRGSFFPGHRDAAGLYFAYGNSEMDVDGLVTNPAATGYVRTRTGTVNLYGYSGGAYWTHYGPGGWYVDGVVQGTSYSGNAATQFANLPTNGSGIITSLEVGYPIPLAVQFAPRFILEPQGQILWQHTSFGTANDGLGPVGLGNTSGATGRLGLRAQSTIATPNGMVWQPYARANLWQNWGGEATTTFGTEGVPLQQQSTQLEFAAGLTSKVNDLLSFYAQAGYEFAVHGATDGGRRQGIKGDIGLRLTFGAPPPPLAAPVAVAAPAPAAARSYLVFFDWDKATLTDRAREIIREAAENSTHVQYTRIAVNGHTDTSGTPRYNMGLSLRRAHAVAAELVRNGVPRNVIAIRGFGQTELLVPTGPGVREPQNRRVEIIIQ